jgi:lipoyl-dependent peroxiredoxin subunit D
MFGTSATTDHAVALLKDLGLDESSLTHDLKLLANTNGGRYLRDLKINVNNSLNAETLQKKEALLLALSVAANEKCEVIEQAFTKLAQNEGATDDQIAEVISCTSLLNANNVYYRFRHFMQEDFYNKAQAGIRMSIMANPVNGKEFFELISLAVSALNGCEMCVTSHEKALGAQGTSKQRIHDAVRLAAVIKSLCVLF